MTSTARNVRKRFRDNRPQKVAANAPDNDMEDKQYRRLKLEKLLDGALEDTFPASDPVSSLSVAS